jgi:hypothetical protein
VIVNRDLVLAPYQSCEESSVSKLKLGAILDDRTVKLTIELPAQVNQDLTAAGPHP